MDEMDIRILKLLESNARISHEEISKLLHLSRPAVHQRVAKMEKIGVIKGYRGVVNWGWFNEKIKALIFVKVKSQNYKEVVEQILALNVPRVAILECQRLAGEWCMMVKVRVSTPQDITHLIDAMVQIPEVRETTTTFILSTIFEDGMRVDEDSL